MVKETRNKFGIQHEIEIKVYDKTNNKCFIIDKSEMRKIPKGGLIRISRPKSKPKGISTASPHKAPFTATQTKADDQKRNEWKIGSKVEIYSESKKKWMKGTIEKVVNDTEGEWLVIRYAGFSTKEIQRFNPFLRPIDKQKNKRRNAPKAAAVHVPKQESAATAKYGDTDEKTEKHTSMSWYYVDSDGETKGPHSISALKPLYGSIINESTYISTTTFSATTTPKWTPLRKVPHLLKQLKLMNMDEKEQQQSPTTDVRTVFLNMMRKYTV